MAALSVFAIYKQYLAKTCSEYGLWREMSVKSIPDSVYFYFRLCCMEMILPLLCNILTLLHYSCLVLRHHFMKLMQFFPAVKTDMESHYVFIPHQGCSALFSIRYQPRSPAMWNRNTIQMLLFHSIYLFLLSST